MATYELRAPLTEEDVTKLRIGDMVYLSGPCFTCRSKLQRWVFDEGNSLPFPTEPGGILIHTGPIVIRENDQWKLMSFMPTSSLRFEKWGAASIEQWNLRLICGKTTMGQETAAAMKQHKCVHVSPQSVSPFLWVDSITIEDVDLLDEMGSIEAPWHFTLDKLGPFVVDMDCEGNNLFDAVTTQVEENRKKAYEALGIPEDFQFTRMYDE